jgi:uncharacterized protein YqeY
MPTIYEQLRADIVVAMKARDNTATTALRTADAAIKRAAMDQNKEIDDSLVVACLRKAVKTMSEALADFTKGGRTDLAEANAAEIRLLEKYLPKSLDEASLGAILDEVIRQTGAQSRKEMGKVMGALKQHPQADVIDFSSVSKLLQTKLQ